MIFIFEFSLKKYAKFSKLRLTIEEIVALLNSEVDLR